MPFSSRHATRTIYYDYDKPRVKQVPLDLVPRFTPEDKAIQWEKLEGELVATHAHYLMMANRYKNALDILNEYGWQRVQEACRKAAAIAGVYYEVECDYEIIDHVDDKELESIFREYGMLTTLDRYILAGMGMDHLLEQAGKVLAASMAILAGKDERL